MSERVALLVLPNFRRVVGYLVICIVRSVELLGGRKSVTISVIRANARQTSI